LPDTAETIDITTDPYKCFRLVSEKDLVRVKCDVKPKLLNIFDKTGNFRPLTQSRSGPPITD